MTIACGDSHTSTHGALGAIAFGIGTSQVRDVLASQCLALEPLKVRRIDVNGRLAPGRLCQGCDPDDHPPARRHGGVGLRVRVRRIDQSIAMTIDERMTICNMSIEGGARVGYVNPDDTTFAFLRGRAFRAGGRGIRSRGRRGGGSMRLGLRAPRYDDRVVARRGVDRADGHLGHQPGPVGRHRRTRLPRDADEEALTFMGFERGAQGRGHANRRRVHRVVHERAALGSRGGGAGSSRAAASRRTSRRSSCRARRP